MNRSQKVVLILGLIVILAMMAYPPWYCSTWAASGPRPPAPPGTMHIPEVEVRVTRYAPMFPYPTQRLRKPALNLPRLAIQCVVVAVLTTWLAHKVRT